MGTAHQCLVKIVNLRKTHFLYTALEQENLDFMFLILNVILALSVPTLCLPCRFFDRCILTGRALELILYDFSSNFIMNM